MKRKYLIQNLVNGRLFAKVFTDSESHDLLTNLYIQKKGFRIIKSVPVNENEKSELWGKDSKGNFLPIEFIH